MSDGQRPIDRRRMVIYTETEEQKARIFRAAARWAEKNGVPQARSVSRFCIAMIARGLETWTEDEDQTDDQPALEREDQLEVGALRSGAQRAVEVWCEQPYDHRRMADAIDALREQMKEDER